MSHSGTTDPSPWVRNFAPLIRRGGLVLDVACGGGRHGRFLLQRAHEVILLDRDVSAVRDLAGHPRAEVIEADLEGAEPLPVAGRRFAAIVVVNYLYRPLVPQLIDLLEDGGVLIYETFARGNERFGRPRNPDFLLESGELLGMVRGRLQVVAYEHGLVGEPCAPAVKQRICAVKPSLAEDEGEGGPTAAGRLGR